MSRVGKRPIRIPPGIQVEVRDRTVVVKGQNGALEQKLHPEMKISVADGSVHVESPFTDRFHKALHGLTRTLIQNMILGVKDGFTKRLEIQGVGYRAELKGKALVVQVGYSHPIYFLPPEGIVLETPSQTLITVKGMDKQLVGQVASKIRSFRPPEPYKGKGIRYEGEYVRRKAGKATA
ncbi:50S ribosomal protein L6 [bacterium]|nr:50S ribosomal protein L6 [bacterium]